MDLFLKIRDLLDQNIISYELKEHPPTATSEESARHRGEPLKIGAKAILLKTDDTFILAVFPADRKLDSKQLKKLLGSKKLRFATEEELQQITGCIKGAVPPFGQLFGTEMIIDEALFDEEYMAFNAGSLEQSMKMKTVDYQKLIQSRKERFTE